MPAVGDEPRFATNLYRGTAEAYDLFRLSYPKVMLEDLLSRVGPSGRGRLLDLACGTGQLAFALGHAFAEVWAADQEPDMIRVVEAKATTGSSRIRPVLSPGEDLGAPPGWFELITVGNAFHRLRRDLIARKAFEWLEPGGHVALCWSDSPWAGQADWQQALSETLGRWRGRLGADERIPQGWEVARQQRPDLEVMADAGFVMAGRHAFVVEHRWSVDELIGFVYSTSFLPVSVVAEHAAAFESDLVARLSPYARDGMLTQAVSFAYELSRRP
jgi:SAM-dependent methyltransferase